MDIPKPKPWKKLSNLWIIKEIQLILNLYLTEESSELQSLESQESDMN